MSEQRGYRKTREGLVVSDKMDKTICGDQDPYAKEHPEYRDEAGFRRNT